AAVARSADVVTCVSIDDAMALRQLTPGLRPVVVANGIELPEYPLPRAEALAGATVTFSGKMDYRPNVDAILWFADQVWPRIREHCPDARCVVVGMNPTERLRRAGRTAGLEVVGAVVDTRPYIASAAVYIAPLRMGGGTRFKLLEAMAMGRPVVSTTLGAEGFALTSGRELLIADTPADFAGAVLRLLEDAALARRIG